MRVKLTNANVEKLTVKPSGDAWLWDADVPGLGVRLKPSGARSYVFRYAQGRRDAKGRVTLGQHGQITLDKAREIARRMTGAVADGVDPVAEARTERGIPTLKDFAKRYEADHGTVKKKASSWKKDESLLKLHVLPALGAQVLDKITAGQLARLHASLSAKPITANRVLSLVSHMFTKAEDWRVLPPKHDNPARGVERYEETPRERYLTTAEIRRLGAALRYEDKKGHAFGAAAIRAHALTGTRPGEMLGLRRDKTDLKAGRAWRPRKRGSPWIVLPEAACLVLKRVPILRGSPWFFPGHVRGKHLTIWGLEQIWQGVRKRAKLEDVRLQDLRHTFASIAAGGGASLPLIGGLLGHTQPKTTARYAHLADGPMRAVAERAADTISAALRTK